MNKLMNHAESFKYLLFLSFLFSLCLVTIAADKQNEASKNHSFEYLSAAKGNDKTVRFIVTSEGLSQIDLGKETVAKGKWEAQDFSTIMDFQCNYDWRKARKDAEWKYTEKKLLDVDEKHVRVLHRSTEIEVIYDYIFSGEDVEVQTLIKNLSDRQIVQAVKFQGLTFSFNREPSGLFTPMAVGYPGQIIPTCREANFHPCFGANFGGSELVDDNFGVGATPLRSGETPSVLAWEGYKKKDLAFQYVRGVTLTPGSSFRCDFLLRISRNKDWKYLLEPYKRHFNTTFGSVRYKNSNKPIGFIQGTSDKWIKEGNPFGYGGKYRFDTDEGARCFIDESIPVLKKANAQGMIVWSFTPWNPRGCNFRPDTDALPTEVWKQIPVLTSAYNDAGMGFGICMRPQIVTTYDWKSDYALTIHPDDLSQLGFAIRPFNKLMKEGMKTFYLDTFGGAPSDARTMKFLREIWNGQQVFTCTEFWSDVSLLYSPGYSHFNWDKEKKKYYEFWHREHLWEVCQWMSPGVQLVSPGGTWDPKNERPDGTPDPFRFLYQNHVIPIFHTGTRTTVEMAEQLNALTKEFLNDKGEFIK